jgi:outer membrane biosynthesis protein TonB
MSCIERLQMPRYPPLARQAAIQGSVKATVDLAPDASIQMKLVGHRLLSQAVETAVRASRFRPGCGGKSVSLIFNFEFDSDPAKIVSFGYPNQFWISAQPPIPMID